MKCTARHDGDAAWINVTALSASDEGLNSAGRVNADDCAVITAIDQVWTGEIDCGGIAYDKLAGCVHRDADWINQVLSFCDQPLGTGTRVNVNNPADDSIIQVRTNDIGHIKIVAMHGNGTRGIEITGAGDDFLVPILRINAKDLARKSQVGHEQ